ncbi:MAG: transglutaminase family protein [Acidobacteriota bacterium]|nr:transglutaminase family protein [Acidobacteriota bacterium]
MRYKVTHRTAYRYNYPVSVGNHLACLRPRALATQRLESFTLNLSPVPGEVIEREDYYGNTLHLFSIQEPHRDLVVEAQSEVEVLATTPTYGSSVRWEEAAALLPQDHSTSGLDAYQFRFESPRIRLRSEFAGYARQSLTPARPLREGLLELTDRLHREFRFQPNATSVSTTVDEVFARRRGVCQDFAQMQIAMLRSLGLAARYVSGYLRTTPPPGQERLVGADASHAWISVYCPGEGWLDLDPTNNVVPGTDHITVSWGRDFSDVSPLRGLILGGGVQALKVGVDVEELPALATAAP